MSNHKLNGAKGTYTLGFGDGAASKFDSPLKIEIIYDAIIEATADGIISFSFSFM